MRGNPLLRAAVLAVALCLTSILVASVLRNGKRTVAPLPPEDAPPATLIPAILDIVLSAPAKSIIFTEPTGRVIAVPLTDGHPTLHPIELTINPSDHTWIAGLSIEWQDPSGALFGRFTFEPASLKTATLILNFPGDVSGLPITADFNPDQPAPTP